MYTFIEIPNTLCWVNLDEIREIREVWANGKGELVLVFRNGDRKGYSNASYEDFVARVSNRLNSPFSIQDVEDEIDATLE